MGDSSAQRQASKTVRCPQCGNDSEFAPRNRFRPFCSERCKNLDLGAWASENFKLPDQPSEGESALDHN